MARRPDIMEYLLIAALIGTTGFLGLTTILLTLSLMG
jgi:hypothetical protein